MIIFYNFEIKFEIEGLATLHQACVPYSSRAPVVNRYLIGKILVESDFWCLT